MTTNNFNNRHVNNTVNPSLRGWLIFAQFTGTILSVIGLMTFIYYTKNISNSLSSNDTTGKSLFALILSILVYFVWRSIYTSWVIVRFAKNSTDEELCANRYIISALSLGVGGLFTPFLMTQFPNMTTTSTMKPRYFLSKIMGICLLIGSPIFAITYFLSNLFSINRISMLFDISQTSGFISVVVLVASVLFFLFGLITTSLFNKKETLDEFENHNISPSLKVISTIWMVILTIELLVVILMAIVRLMGAFLELFKSLERNSGIFMFVFGLFNLMITFSYVMMVVYVTKRTMLGLWANDGVVVIKEYRHNTVAQKRMAANSNI